MIADLNWNATEWFRVVKNGGSFSQTVEALSDSK
jgi:hypothetical protein